MKKLFVVLFVLALVVIGVGFYRNWFGLTVNADKMSEDADKVKAKSAELTDNARD